MKHIQTYILALCVAALVSCAVLRKAGWTGGGAATGGLIGSAVGGPVGAGVGAGVGAVSGSAIVENSELREGDLYGAGALERRPTDGVVVRHETPAWCWWLVGFNLTFLAIKLIGSDRYRGLVFGAIGRLVRLDFAGAVKDAAKASGMAHSRVISQPEA